MPALVGSAVEYVKSTVSPAGSVTADAPSTEPVYVGVSDPRVTDASA